MENKQKDTVGLQLTKLNTLYQKPTNHARRKPMDKRNRNSLPPTVPSMAIRKTRRTNTTG